MIVEVDDQERPLPPNWTAHVDSTHNVPYYLNASTGESSWEHPSEQPTPQSQPQSQPKRTQKAAYHAAAPTHLVPSTTHIDDEGSGTLCGDDFPYTMPIFEVDEDRVFDNNHGRGGCGYSDDGDGGDEWGDDRAPVGQDYVHMARQYKVQRPYTDPSQAQQCVLCRRQDATHVLFPCEHRCLCWGCIANESICPDSKMAEVADGHCNCPLCATIIKKIMPFEGGAEVEKYWLWVYEIKPKLSDKFMKKWKHSASVIDAVWVVRPEPPLRKPSISCTIS